MQFVRHALLLGAVGLLLAGCSQKPFLNHHGTHYYAGRVRNADLVMEIVREPGHSGLYSVWTAPTRIGHPVSGWKITKAEAKAALAPYLHMRPLELQNVGFLSYDLLVHVSQPSGIPCNVLLRRHGLYFSVSDGGECHIYSGEGRTPVSGPNWALVPSHRVFYPLVR